MDKVCSTSLDLNKVNIEALKQLFPNVVTEGKIDFDALRTMLGDEVENEREQYHFTWHGKQQSINLAKAPSTATLRPCKEESKNWDTTENLYIEGDNLEVLKQLQKTYYGKIKMIYIDPPYNTGNDFVYNDNFSNTIEKYKQQTNQKLVSNPEYNGRFHTDWLNMMYSRLYLARNLLTEDGFIFISIDDNEYANLFKICIELFGENNYLGTYIKQSKVGGGSDTKFIVKEHEYCIVLAKNINKASEMFVDYDEDYLKRYKEQDERGRYFWDTFARPGLKNPIYYDIIAPDGTILNNGWIHGKERFEQEIKDGIVRITKKGEGWSVQCKQYMNQNGKKPRSMTMDFGGSIEGRKDIAKLFESEKIFSYPKSEKYLKTLISTIDFSEGIVLDFFSGSATTAQAVMKLNAEDGGHRKFIMVQLPEKCDENSEAYKAGYKNICDIGKERIRRAGDKIIKELQPVEDELFASNHNDFDIGFKVFKLDSTNIKTWDDNVILKESDLLDLENVFKEDRNKEDILYEVMLKYGIFNEPVSEVNVNDKTMYRVGKRHMLVCLEDTITKEDIAVISELKPHVVVFKESGFANDNDKINAVKNLMNAGIEDVKAI